MHSINLDRLFIGLKIHIAKSFRCNMQSESLVAKDCIMKRKPWLSNKIISVERKNIARKFWRGTIIFCQKIFCFSARKILSTEILFFEQTRNTFFMKDNFLQKHFFNEILLLLAKISFCEFLVKRSISWGKKNFFGEKLLMKNFLLL